MQGVSGLGEVRDGSSPDTALRLKHRLVGQTPSNVDYPLTSIKAHGGYSREAVASRTGTGYFDPTDDCNRLRVGFDRGAALTGIKR